MWKIPLFKPNYTKEDEEAVLHVLRNGWLAMGEKTERFEVEFSKYLGESVSSVALSNCTAALHIALLCAGVGPGDEVLIPASTFVADYNVVKLCGAEPILVDAESLLNWNMSTVDLENKITKKTKAVIAVHFAGYPFSENVVKIAKQHNLLLIEDTAHAVGASRNGKKCGTLGDIAAFSFFANKNLAVGEGGMFVTQNTDFTEKAKLIRSHGMSKLPYDRFRGDGKTYDVLEPGLNYRICEFSSSLGLVQLGILDENNERRKKLTEQYNTLLKNTDLIIPFTSVEDDVEPAYHIYPVLLPETYDREAVIDKLKEKGIQVSIHYPSLQSFTLYANLKKQNTSVSDTISKRVITLPLYPSMQGDDVELVADELIKCL